MEMQIEIEKNFDRLNSYVVLLYDCKGLYNRDNFFKFCLISIRGIKTNIRKNTKFQFHFELNETKRKEKEKQT